LRNQAVYRKQIPAKNSLVKRLEALFLCLKRGYYMALIQLTQTMTEQEARATQNTNNANLDSRIPQAAPGSPGGAATLDPTTGKLAGAQKPVYTPEEIGAVPVTRKIANIPLSSDITLTQICNLIYPVGSIYLSTNATNPGTYLGGTWVAWGAGRVPVGVGSNGTTNYASAEMTGGVDSVVLTSEQAQTPNTWVSDLVGGQTSFPNIAINSGSTYGLKCISSNATAHENRQPFITCYMWKRTD
jgi:hypothetical protein